MKRKTRNDLILIAGVTIVALAAFAALKLTQKTGAYAVVYQNGTETSRYSLSQDITVRIGDDETYNVLVIKDGEAQITEASCPNHLCIRQGKISADGEMIICVPNKVVVEIEGGNKTSVDAVS